MDIMAYEGYKMGVTSQLERVIAQGDETLLLYLMNISRIGVIGRVVFSILRNDIIFLIFWRTENMILLINHE